MALGASELSALMAAVRLPADVLASDERTPDEAVSQPGGLLDDFNRAATGLAESNGRHKRPF